MIKIKSAMGSPKHLSHVFNLFVFNCTGNESNTIASAVSCVLKCTICTNVGSCPRLLKLLTFSFVNRAGSKQSCTSCKKETFLHLVLSSFKWYYRMTLPRPKGSTLFPPHHQPFCVKLCCLNYSSDPHFFSPCLQIGRLISKIKTRFHDAL